MLEIFFSISYVVAVNRRRRFTSEKIEAGNTVAANNEHLPSFPMPHDIKPKWLLPWNFGFLVKLFIYFCFIFLRRYTYTYVCFFGQTTSLLKTTSLLRNQFAGPDNGNRRNFFSFLLTPPNCVGEKFARLTRDASKPTKFFRTPQIWATLKNSA